MKNIRFNTFLVLILVEAVIMIGSGSVLANTISSAPGKKSSAYKSSYDAAYYSNYNTFYKSSYNENYRSTYDNSYQTAYDEQYKTSYDAQYNTSYNIQYLLNYNSSYNANYNSFYKSAYDSQYEISYNKSYPDGQIKGINNGTEDGIIDGEKTKVPLHNPTYQELLSFLSSDHTDQKTYNEINYNCTDFSTELDNNAESSGINAAIVLIYFPQDPGHSIVAFQTTDRDIVYIEPQNDYVVILQKGKSYHLCEVLPPGYYWLPSSIDDTVVDYTVIW